MAHSKFHSIAIKHVYNYFPAKKHDNLELSQLSLEDRQRLVEQVGIRYRYRAKETSSIFSAFEKATENLIEKVGWEKNEVDLLIVVSQSNQNLLPSIASQIQGNLALNHELLAYDISAGCSGFVNGLFNTFSNLNSLSKSAAKAILCCGDFSSRLIEEDNLSCLPIFSDAVSATAIEFHPKHSDVSASFMQETFGEGSGAIYTEMIKQKLAMKMNGIDVFAYSSEYVPSNIKALLEKEKLAPSAVDHYILHQANQIINTSIEKSVGIKPSQTASSLYDYGNTSSASIPITLSKLNPTKAKANYLMSGFGVGFSIASILLQNHPSIPVSMQVGDF